MNTKYTDRSKMSGVRMVGGIDVPTDPTWHAIMEVCAPMRQFFTPEKWGEWCDAGPDDNAGFLEYAKAEWFVIAQEHMTDPLVPEAEAMQAELARDAHWLNTGGAYMEGEDLGTHTTVSGGEVLELGNTTNDDEEMPI